MKKILPAILVLAICAGALAGCGGSAPPAATTQAAATTAAPTTAAPATEAAEMAGSAAEAATEAVTEAPAATEAAATEAPATTAAQAQPVETEPAEDAPAAANAPSYLQDTSPITFDWYVDTSWYTRAKWGLDATSKYITAKTGVTINIILPTGNEAERKNLMIASGDVPDFVSMGQWETARQQMIEAGLVYSLNELADAYAPDFWDYTTASVSGWYTEKDGKVYGYPCGAMPIERLNLPENSGSSVSYLGFTVRKDIYEAIGSPDMSTPDGFLQALLAAKEQYPKIGNLDLIPFSFGYEFTDKGNSGINDNIMELLNVPTVDENGALVNRFEDPDFIMWLKTFRKANEMGLMPKETFIDKSPQIEDEFMNGQVFSSVFAVNNFPNKVNGKLYEQDPNSVYIQIEAMQNSKKDKPLFKAGGLSGWLWTTISRTNKNPERAIRFMQYWLSEEGQADFWLGDPAVTRTPEGDRVIREIYDLRGADETAFCDTYGNMDNYFMLIDGSITNRWEYPDIPAHSAQIYEFQMGRHKDATVLNNLDPSPESAAGIEYNKSQVKWGTLLPKMLLAETDEEFDRLYAEYKATDDAARAVYLPVMQENYDFNAQKLGLK